MKLKSKWLLISLFIILAIAVPVISICCYHFYMNFLLSKKIQELSRKGYPTTFEELDISYKQLSSEENAAIIYQKAADKFDEINGKYFMFSSSKLTDMKKFIEDNISVIELINEGCKKMKCRYQDDFSKGWAATDNYYNIIHRCIGILLVKYDLDMGNKNFQNAAEAISNCLQLANTLKDVPGFYTMGTRFYKGSEVIEKIERLLNASMLQDAEIERLMEHLNDKNELMFLKSSLVVKMIYIRELSFEEYVDSSHARPFYKGSQAEARLENMITYIYCAIGLDLRDKLNIINMISNLAEACGKSIHTVQEELKKSNTKNSYAIANHFLEDVNNDCRKEIEFISLLRIARCSLAIEKYRNAKNKKPNSLQELVPEYIDSVPKDPYNGRNINYKNDDKGYIVYSVGKDLIDNGGVKRTYLPGTGGKEIEDITFKIER